MIGSDHRDEESPMGKVIYWAHASVDGFIDGPKGEFDKKLIDPAGGIGFR